MSSCPNWDHVPFDVGCARCGHDLRGLTDPVCPQCGLEFDWANAVPIEELTCLHCEYHLYGLEKTRCPECGETFTWKKVLDDYRRREKPLFEYRWREKPVRSYLRTWLWAVWPPKLWSKMDIHDPLQVLPLLGMVAIALFLFGMSMVVLEGLYDWVRLVMRYSGTRWALYAPSISEVPVHIMRAFSDVYLREAFALTLIWLFVSLASLMIFRQSMGRCKVRTVHVVRTWAYSGSLMLPTVSVLSYISPYISVLTDTYFFPDGDALLSLLLLCHVTYSLYRGYRTYLGMPHSVAIAVASQLVAVIGTATVYFALLPRRFGRSVAIDILRTLGLWW